MISQAFNKSQSNALISLISDSAENILMETTCLVIKPPLITLKRNGTYGYVDLIEGLTNHG
jgi:hypothetical protein